MSANHEKVEALFHEALKFKPAERPAFLAGACGSDLELRRQLEVLLQAEAEAGGFLPETPEQMAPTVVPITENVGDQIGHYKLLQKVGEGGCGVVYMAEQEEPVRRRVALKVIKLGMDTKSVVARFEAERQALAMMDHPNIARVLDAGATDKGRPFFVMELVRGIRITEYCDQNHLTTQARLELFITVCHAVQHAHQKGIIHRDLKPSNILVTLHDGVPVPKVIDFGIAKAIEQKLTDKTLFTELNQFMGTPAYMSPEQAEMSGLDIDTRSDIYSLGVLLYELLSGRTPFDARELVKEGLDAIRRTIREVEPPRPSTRLSTLAHADLNTVAKARGTGSMELRSQLRGDLDWIVMKALEKDRTRRYETANGFALDLRRHLADEPVTARAPSAGYKFGKFARRNKVAFAVAATIAAVLVIATGISLWQAVRATKAEALAKQRLTESESISKFLTEVFQSPDPARDGRTITVAERLDTAVKNLDVDLAAQPARRAQLQATLASTYYALGLYREAIPLQEKARDYYRAAAGPEQPMTLDAMHKLANSYSVAGRRDEALAVREEVLKLQRKANGLEHPDTIKAMNNLANSYFDAGRRDEALGMQEDLLALYRRVKGPEHSDTLSAMAGLATSYSGAGRTAEALRLRLDVLEHCRKVLGPEHPDTLKAMNNLANSYEAAGRQDEALRLRQDVLPLRLRLLGPEHPLTLRAMENLAKSYHDAARQEEALKLRQEVLELSRKVSGPAHPDTFAAMHDLAISYSDAGRTEEALNLREEVLTGSRKANGPDHPSTLDAMQNLSISYEGAGRRDEALKMGEALLTLSRRVNGPEHPKTLDAMHNLAVSYDHASRQDEALKLWEEVLPLRRKVSGPEHRHTINAMHNLALSYSRLERWDEALKLREEILTLRRKMLGTEHRDTLDAMHNLAVSYDDASRPDEALKLWEEVLPLRRKVSGPEHRDTLSAINKLADSYSDAGRWDEAEKLYREWLALCRRIHGNKHHQTVNAIASLARILADRRRADDGVALVREMLGIDRELGATNLNQLSISLNEDAELFARFDHFTEAEAIYREILPFYQKRYAEQPAKWADFQLRVAACDYRLGKYAEAELLLREALAQARNSGTNSSSELNSRLGEIAELSYRQKQYAPAELLYREQIRRRRPGAEQSETVIGATASLGRLLTDWAWVERATNASTALQHAREGEALVRDALASRSRQTNTTAWRMADLQSRLGGALCVLAVTDPAVTPTEREPTLTEAEKLLQQGHAGLEQDKKSESKYQRDALERLVRLYEEWGKPEKLAEWKQKLAEFEKAATATPSPPPAAAAKP